MEAQKCVKFLSSKCREIFLGEMAEIFIIYIQIFIFIYCHYHLHETLSRIAHWSDLNGESNRYRKVKRNFCHKNVSGVNGKFLIMLTFIFKDNFALLLLRFRDYHTMRVVFATRSTSCAIVQVISACCWIIINLTCRRR